MLLIIVVFFTVLMTLEMQLDMSHENRIINPIIGFVVTLLGSSLIFRGRGPETRPLHILHMVLFIACLLYVRAMIDVILRFYFFEKQ